MALRFAWRADDANLYARYSNQGKYGVATPFGAGPTRASDAGAIGGYNVGFSSGTKALAFRGANFISGNTWSLVIRIKSNYTGAPAATRGIFYIGAGNGTVASLNPYYGLTHQTATGNFLLSGRNELGTAIATNMNMGAWSPTSGTWYDLTICSNGTTGAGGLSIGVNNSVLGTGTAAAALSASLTNEYWKELIIGANNLGATSDLTIGEIAIFDTFIDVTANQNLESGLGLLNGASRTSFISDVAGATLTAFDGLNSTDPGVGYVLTDASTYYINGVAKTPTYVKVAPANVRLATAFGAASAETGLAAIPTAANVRSGTATDQTTGTAAIPIAANVRSGTATDATTGTLVVPSASNVRFGTSVDATTGTCVVPTAANTKIGISVDVSDTGTYDGSDRWTDPGEANVATGVQYKANSTSNNKTGTLDSVVNEFSRITGLGQSRRLHGVVR